MFANFNEKGVQNIEFLGFGKGFLYSERVR